MATTLGADRGSSSSISLRRCRYRLTVRKVAGMASSSAIAHSSFPYRSVQETNRRVKVPGADAVSKGTSVGADGFGRTMIADGIASRACERPQTREECYGGRSMAFVPDRAGFLDLARRGRLSFVYREVVADADTPVSAYAKLGRGPYSFLLESVVGGEKWAAYSFVGVRPRAVIRARGTAVEVLQPAPGDNDGFRVGRARDGGRSAAVRRRLPGELTPAVPPGLPRFFGGAVGWLGYDIVRASRGCRARSPTTSACPSSASSSPTRW